MYWCAAHLKVEHGLLQVGMDTAAPGGAGAGVARLATHIVVHVLVEICTEALGSLVCAVCWRTERDGFGSTHETVAHGVDLNFISNL